MIDVILKIKDTAIQLSKEAEELYTDLRKLFDKPLPAFPHIDPWTKIGGRSNVWYTPASLGNINGS